jgi:hypothetical protein
VRIFCKFEILRGLRKELILGVPDILSKFKLVFLEMVMNASSDLSFIVALNELMRRSGNLGRRGMSLLTKRISSQIRSCL